MRQKYYCHTCKKEVEAVDLDQHLEMHREKNEACEVQHANGSTYDQPANKGKQSGVKRPGLGGKK